MIAKLTDIVLIVTGFQLILLSVAILARRNGIHLQRFLLSGFLISKAFLTIRWFLFSFGVLTFERAYLFYYFSAAGFFLLAPVLYLYIQALTNSAFRLSHGCLKHLIPVIGMSLFTSLTLMIWLSGDQTNPSALSLWLSERFWNCFWTLNFLQILVYLLKMVTVVRTYQRSIRETYSSIEQFDLRWLQALLAVIGLHWLFVVSRGLLGIFGITTPTLLSLLDLFSIMIFLCFTTILVIKGLGQLAVIPGVKHQTEETPETPPPDLVDITTHIEQLDRVMATSKPYLQPSLTIDELAAQLALPTHVLSRVINSGYEQSFFNFINSHRVAAAKIQLESPANNQKTMLRILHEVGFNSKSSFNEAFKRHSGMTPSAFRRQAQSIPAP